MKILLEHIFIKKKFRKKLAENVLGSGSGSGQKLSGSATLPKTPDVPHFDPQRPYNKQFF
jgi:hypothetical protein